MMMMIEVGASSSEEDTATNNKATHSPGASLVSYHQLPTLYLRYHQYMNR